MRFVPVLAAVAVVSVLHGVAGARAQDRPAVVVTPGAARSFGAALQRFQAPDSARAERFRDAIGRALDFSGAFRQIPPRAFLGPEVTTSLADGDPPVCTNWTQIGADALVRGAMRVEAGQLVVEFQVWDTVRCAPLARKRYRQDASADPDVIARRIGDEVVEAFIGIRGVASTELAFVSNRGGNPEIYVMDADGGNARAATANRSINNFPSWSTDGNSILYTSYRYRNRPTLFLSTRGSRQPGRLLARLDGSLQQYRGVYAPTGDRVALVMSAGTAADIYTARADGRGLTRLTRNRAIDVSPSWSPDGRQIAFVSDRTGVPQIYVMGADGKAKRRLTYQGSYNTNPVWSPDGRWIAYETRVGGQFDIWLIDPAGSVNVPLISHPRSDEAPSWAPNSRKLAFSSRRRGRADIYIVDVNGENLRRITRDAGDNTSPAWDPIRASLARG